MTHAALDPRDAVFHAPWQARAFAIALSLCRQSKFEWEEFRQLLIAEISGQTGVPHGSEDYYRRFLRALEKLLAAGNIVGPGEVSRRVNLLSIS